MAKANKLLFRVNDLSKTLGKRNVLEHISFKVHEGEIVTIIGPNGSGKTSLARIILGLDSCTSGEVIFEKKMRFGYIPQSFEIDKSLPLTVAYFLDIFSNGELYSDYAKEFIERLKLEKLFKRQLSDLSGGELQRVLLMNALMMKPDLLVMDEPIQGVDLGGQIEFYHIIGELAKEHNIAILMISHDLIMVMQKTNHVLCLNNHLCCQGPAEAIASHPEYVKLFGKKAEEVFAVYTHNHNHEH